MDGESVLPPPFTIFYLLHKLIAGIYHKLTEAIIVRTAKHRHGAAADIESPTLRQKHEQEMRLANDKKLFEKRYTHLMIMLINSTTEKEKIS